MSRRLLDLPFGYIETFDDNEVTIVSTISDPVKIRLAIQEDQVEANLGFLSFNTVRSDGEQDEWAAIGPRLITRPDGSRFCAIAVCARGPESEHVQEVLLIAPHGVWFNVPLRGDGAPTPDDGTVAMSKDGRFWTVQQSDGNLVIYQLAVPFDKGTGTAFWSSGTGGR